MRFETSTGQYVEHDVVHKYLCNLVNKFFKILPIRESEDESLSVYMESLQVELIGFKELIKVVNCDHEYTTLLAILQYLISNTNASVKVFKREVFRSISICNKLKQKYSECEAN